MSQYIDSVRQKLPSLAEIDQFISVIKQTNKDQIIEEFKEFKITPVTISITLTTLTALFLIGKLFGSSSSKPSSKLKKNQKKKQKKKISNAQKTNQEIQKILDFVEDNYVPQINEYLANHRSLKPVDIEYKYKYFEEMLLKELMKLDGIDVTGNEVLRENRRKVIKFIQDHQKRLDAFKREFNY